MMRRSLAILAFACFAAVAQPIVPNVLAPEFTSVVRISSTNGGGTNGSGTAINEFFVLTAKHVGGNWIQFGNAGSGAQTFQAVERIAHPTADIALLRFANPLPVFTSILFGDHLGATATMVGYGASGTLRADGTGYDMWPNTSGAPGTRRKGNNVLDERFRILPEHNFGSGVTNSLNFMFDLDGPTGNGSTGGPAIAGEASLGPGDSGGGTFRFVNNEWRLIGVNSFIWSVQNDGDYHDWGDGGGIVDLNEYQQWITTNAVPEPGTMLALAGGIAALALRRRRK